MNPWFIWKGENSLRDYGLWINKLPKRIRAGERHEQIEIPGRAGSLVMLEGDDVYSSYSAEMVVIAKNTLDIHAISKWLRGASDLILSTDLSKAIEARIVGEVAFERIGNCLQQATIPFLCQPFRKSVFPSDDAITIVDSGTVYNPGDVKAFPKMTINATGAGQEMSISVNGSAFTVDFSDMADTGCIVSSETEIVTNYAENVILTEKTSGSFPVLQPGNNTITLVSGVSSINIAPNWRWF